MSIRLHREHGVNPTMTTCFICGESKDILLVGSATKQFKEVLSEDGKMPMNIGVVDKEPCQKCQEYMQQGIILISVKDGDESGNPYRTGGWVVIKEEALNFITDDAVRESILKSRISFIPDTVWESLSLPKGE